MPIICSLKCLKSSDPAAPTTLPLQLHGPVSMVSGAGLRCRIYGSPVRSPGLWHPSVTSSKFGPGTHRFPHENSCPERLVNTFLGPKLSPWIPVVRQMRNLRLSGTQAELGTAASRSSQCSAEANS